MELTEAAELADDGRQGVVGDILQLPADALGQGALAEVARLDVPLHQRHDDPSHLDHTPPGRARG